jgi:hypothetical protein
MIRIEITPEQREWAIQVAKNRDARAIARGAGPGHGDEHRPEEIKGRDAEHGAFGEHALCNLWGVPFLDTVYEFGKPDVLGFEVKTRSAWDYQIYIPKSDPPGKKYVLLTGGWSSLSFIVRGWCRGDQFRQDRYLAAYGNKKHEHYYIPNEELHPIDDPEHCADCLETLPPIVGPYKKIEPPKGSAGLVVRRLPPSQAVVVNYESLPCLCWIEHQHGRFGWKCQQAIDLYKRVEEYQKAAKPVPYEVGLEILNHFGPSSLPYLQGELRA